MCVSTRDSCLYSSPLLEIKVMKLIIILSLILLSFVSCATPSKEKDKAELHLRIGTAHLNQGNYPLALRELLEAHKLDPSNPIVCNNLALAYFVRSKLEESEKYFKKAIELDPKYTEARNNLGRTYIELNRFNEAIATLNEVTKDLTYTEPEKGFANLGLAYYRTKNFQAAQKKFREALQANNNFCPAHGFYGQTLFQLKEYKKAADATDRALQVCPNLDEAHYYGALSYLKLGQKERGMARMREIVELYPNSQYAAKARALVDKDESGIE
jgi:type IV pilus assembly protein PilF